MITSASMLFVRFLFQLLSDDRIEVGLIASILSSKNGDCCCEAFVHHCDEKTFVDKFLRQFLKTYIQGRRSGYESGGGTAYMSTQREVVEGQTGSHRAKRANFGRGLRGSSPGKFQKPTWQMVQSTLFLSYICEYY